MAKGLRLSKKLVGDHGPVLFGDLPHEIERARETGSLLIAEGEIDYALAAVLASRGDIQAGVIGLPGASSGSAIAELIIDRIGKSDIPRFVLALDNDDAGSKSLVKMAGVLAGFGGVCIPELPAGQDITDVVRTEGRSALLSRLARMDLARFRTTIRGMIGAYLRDQVDREEIIGRIDLASRQAGVGLERRAILEMVREVERASALSSSSRPSTHIPAPPITRKWELPRFRPLAEIQSSIEMFLLEQTARRGMEDAPDRPAGVPMPPALCAAGLGSGKSTIAARVIRQACEDGAILAYAAPRHENLDQFEAMLGIPVKRTPDIRRTCAMFSGMPFPREAMNEYWQKRKADYLAGRSADDGDREVVPLPRAPSPGSPVHPLVDLFREEHKEATRKRVDRFLCVCDRMNCPIVKINRQAQGSNARDDLIQGCTYHEGLRDFQAAPGVPALTTHALAGQDWVQERLSKADALVVDENPIEQLVGIEVWELPESRGRTGDASPFDLRRLGAWIAREGARTAGLPWDASTKQAVSHAAGLLSEFAVALSRGDVMSKDWHRSARQKWSRGPLKKGAKKLAEILTGEAAREGPSAVPVNVVEDLAHLATAWPRAYAVTKEGRHDGSADEGSNSADGSPSRSTTSPSSIVVRLRSRWSRHIPITILDGTGDPDTYRIALRREDLVLGPHDVVPTPHPESRTWWVPRGPDGRTRTYSRSFFKPRMAGTGTEPSTGKPIRELVPDEKRLAVVLRQLDVILGEEKRIRKGRVPSVGVITHGFLEEHVQRFIQAQGATFIGSRHYGATAGMNDLKDAEVLFLIGISRPTEEAYVRMALVLGYDPAGLDLSGGDPDGRPLLVDEVFLGERVRYHRLVGEREEIVYWNTIVPEPLQAAGRARQHLAGRTVYYLGCHPLPIPGMAIWPACLSGERRMLDMIERVGVGGISLEDLRSATGLEQLAALRILRKLRAWGKVDCPYPAVYVLGQGVTSRTTRMATSSSAGSLDAARQDAVEGRSAGEAGSTGSGEFMLPNQSTPPDQYVQALVRLVEGLIGGAALTPLDPGHPPVDPHAIARFDPTTRELIVDAAWADQAVRAAGLDPKVARKAWASRGLIRSFPGDRDRLTIGRRLNRRLHRCIVIRVERLPDELASAVVNWQESAVTCRSKA